MRHTFTCAQCGKETTDFNFEPGVTKFCSLPCFHLSRRVVRPLGDASTHEYFRKKILDRTKKEGDCWIWQGAKRGDYGMFSYSTKKSIKAHRASWIGFNGRPLSGQCVLHRCDNPLCCNPAHLFAGSHDDNMKDMAKKGRTKFVSVLSPDEVATIKRLFEEGKKPSELAKEYGMSERYMYALRQGVNWKNVEAAP